MKKTVDLAIVIPTLNEQNYIGKLLDSIAEQTVFPKEIVVVDAKSQDKTISEIKKRQKKLPLKYFQIPKYTISRQRNYGAERTSAQNILFLDADVCLKKKDTLEKYMAEVLERKPDIATATILPLSNHWKNKVLFWGTDVVFRASKPIWPMVLAINIYVKREVLKKSGGFDEEIAFAEDHEFLQRVIKDGAKFMFLNKPKIYTSTRRMEYEGRIRYVLKMARSLYYNLFYGYHRNPTKYEYGHFK